MRLFIEVIFTPRRADTLFVYRYYPSQTKVIRSPSAGGVRLSDCIDHVTRGWFPINKAALRTVQRKLKAGEYHQRRDVLISDLQNDHALFGHCIRRARSVMGEECHDFLKALRESDPSTIERLLDIRAEEVSPYRLRDATKLQALRLRVALESGGVARFIAPHLGAPPDDAACCAFLRHLGLNLIAWNYPGLYTKAVLAASRTGVDLSRAVESVLGVSPDAIAKKIAQTWPLAAPVRTALESARVAPGSRSDGSAVDGATQKLLQAAVVGEIYACCRDPEHYPQAIKRWDEVSRHLSEILGSECELGIEAVCEDVAASLSEVVPHLTPRRSGHHSLIEVVARTNHRSKHDFGSNLFAQQCRRELQTILRAVYQKHRRDDDRAGAVALFAERAVPEALFLRGCIFLAKRNALELVPALRLGPEDLAFYREMSGHSREVLLEALLSNAPFARIFEWRNGRQATAVLGSIGTERRLGVLYLEPSEELLHQSDLIVLNYFRALRETLSSLLESEQALG